MALNMYTHGDLQGKRNIWSLSVNQSLFRACCIFCSLNFMGSFFHWLSYWLRFTGSSAIRFKIMFVLSFYLLTKKKNIFSMLFRLSCDKVSWFVRIINKGTPIQVFTFNGIQYYTVANVITAAVFIQFSKEKNWL